MTREFQAKGKFIEALACPQELLNVALLTVDSGIIKNYHQFEGRKGKFFCTALGFFNKIIGYFWGFLEQDIYRFDVNEIQFTFELAFDKNGKHYSTLFNAYPCGYGITQTYKGPVIREYKERFSEKQVSDDFIAKVRRRLLTNEKYIRHLKYDFEDYEYYKQHKLEPVPTDCANLGQHINQDTQSHEVLTKLVGCPDTRVSNLVEVTVVQLSIPLLHEIDPQTPQTQVEEEVKLQAMSSQTLNPQKQDQNTTSQARDKAETHRERESRDLREKKENRNLPKQQINRFNRRKFHRNQK